MPDVRSFHLDELTLAAVTLDDVDELHAIYSDPRTWTHLPSGRHTDRARTEATVRDWLAAWDQDGLGPWTVRDGAAGTLLGHVGCTVRAEVYWNLGYRLTPAAQGRAIATRVASKAVEAAHQMRPELPVIAYLLEHNVASKRVAEKVGLVLRHRGPDAGNPDPTAVRLVYSDRELSADELAAALR